MSRSALRLFTRALTVIVCALAIAVPMAAAKTVDTTFKDVNVRFTKEKAGDPNATNVYVTFKGGVNKFTADVKADGFTVTPIGAGGEYQLTAKEGKSIANGGMLTLRVKTFQGTLKGVRIGDVIFQDDKMNALASGRATGGTLVGDPVYTLYNDLDVTSSLTVNNLRFYYDHAPVDADTLDPSLPIEGSYVPAADAVLAGNGSFKDYTVPPIADGKVFLVQGDVVANGVVVAQFVDGFEMLPIPEPAPALLLAAGLLALAALRRRR